MKIRNGFVSNSSSSSFVISIGENYKNVFDLAKDMIEQVEWLSQNGLIEKLKNTTKDKNTSVMFYSCNYDTYIVKYGEHLFVNTCNNEDWNINDSIGECTAVKLYPELSDGYGEIDFEKLEKISSYWNIDRDFMFKESDTYINCQNEGCYESFVIIEGQEQCPNCLCLVDGSPSKYKTIRDREKKLNRINN